MAQVEISSRRHGRFPLPIFTVGLSIGLFWRFGTLGLPMAVYCDMGSRGLFLDN
jgi:hypothetical protein